MTHSKTTAGETNNDDEGYCEKEKERNAVAVEVGRADLMDLRSAGRLDLTVEDKGEGILRCSIHIGVHPNLYGDIVCCTFQRATVIAAREEEYEEEGAAVWGKGLRDGEESELEARYQS